MIHQGRLADMLDATARLRRVFLALGSALLAACSGCADSDSSIVIDTLRGGGQRVRGPNDGVWGPGSEWTLREVVRLGSAAESGPELFGQAWDIELDEMGRIYVLDRLAKEVRVFDRDGGFVRVLGREGEGPGEFTNPFGLAWGPEGHLWVVDVRLSRYSVFDTTGTHLREYRRTAAGYSWPGRVDSTAPEGCTKHRSWQTMNR